MLSISDVVLRAFFVRLNRAEAERASAAGAPAPVEHAPRGREPAPARRPAGGGPRGRRPR